MIRVCMLSNLYISSNKLYKLQYVYILSTSFTYMRMALSGTIKCSVEHSSIRAECRHSGTRVECRHSGMRAWIASVGEHEVRGRCQQCNAWQRRSLSPSLSLSLSQLLFPCMAAVYKAYAILGRGSYPLFWVGG